MECEEGVRCQNLMAFSISTALDHLIALDLIVEIARRPSELALCSTTEDGRRRHQSTMHILQLRKSEP
jgi:hypothetical protein